MIYLKIDENKFNRLLAKFKNKCTNEIIFKCYKNKLEFNCFYQPIIENEISQICEIAHKDEPKIPWWIDLLD